MLPQPLVSVAVFAVIFPVGVPAVLSEVKAHVTDAACPHPLRLMAKEKKNRIKYLAENGVNIFFIVIIIGDFFSLRRYVQNPPEWCSAITT